MVLGPAGAVGAIATGDAVLAAQAMADLAYIGSAFIAMHERRARLPTPTSSASSTATATTSSIPASSPGARQLPEAFDLRNAGLDPDHLPESDPTKMNFGGGAAVGAWKDIWG